MFSPGRRIEQGRTDTENVENHETLGFFQDPNPRSSYYFQLGFGIQQENGEELL